MRQRGYLIDMGTGWVTGMNVKPGFWARLWLLVHGVRWFAGEPPR